MMKVWQNQDQLNICSILIHGKKIKYLQGGFEFIKHLSNLIILKNVQVGMFDKFFASGSATFDVSVSNSSLLADY
jgi:hypothetical protein